MLINLVTNMTELDARISRIATEADASSEASQQKLASARSAVSTLLMELWAIHNPDEIGVVLNKGKMTITLTPELRDSINAALIARHGSTNTAPDMVV